MSVHHQTEFDVSFKHCDPAGIVFYPRYVEMLNDVVEHWFKHALACDFATLHGARGIAIPVVRLETEFKHPARLGDTLQAELGVERLGTTSMQIRISLRSKGAQPEAPPNLVAHLTIVFVQMEDKRPIAIPPDLRSSAERFLRQPARAT
jgi:4-hydroxybenzoyl-CoA thioesterase